MEGSGREEEREGGRGGGKQGEKECEVGTPQGSEGPQRTGRPSERGRSTGEDVCHRQDNNRSHFTWGCEDEMSSQYKGEAQ